MSFDWTYPLFDCYPYIHACIHIYLYKCTYIVSILMTYDFLIVLFKHSCSHHTYHISPYTHLYTHTQTRHVSYTHPPLCILLMHFSLHHRARHQRLCAPNMKRTFFPPTTRACGGRTGTTDSGATNAATRSSRTLTAQAARARAAATMWRPKTNNL